VSGRVPDAVDLEACLFGGQAFTWWREDATIHGLARGTRVAIDPRDRTWRSVPERPEGFLDVYLGAKRSKPAPLAEDPDLGPLAERLAGVRLLDQDAWEATLAFLISPVNNVPRIQHTIARLCRELGPTVDDSHLVPRPEALAGTTESQLRELGLGFRAPRVIAAAKAVDEGAIDLGALETAPIADAIERLTTLDGVGPKVAECVLCYGLNRDEAFPVDRWVARAGETVLDTEPTPESARERWGDDAAIAQQLLFHGARVGLVDGVDPSPVARFDGWRSLVDADA
jgi:N-glycosylase/DNA lyase